MYIHTAIRATTLCLVPGGIGFALGSVSRVAPHLFLFLMLLALGMVGYGIGLCYHRAGRGGSARRLEDIEVSAGIALMLSFLFAFWTGIAWIDGHGVIREGLLVTLFAAVLAAFILTFVSRVIDHKVPWVDKFIAIVYLDHKVDGANSHNKAG